MNDTNQSGDTNESDDESNFAFYYESLSHKNVPLFSILESFSSKIAIIFYFSLISLNSKLM